MLMHIFRMIRYYRKGDLASLNSCLVFKTDATAYSNNYRAVLYKIKKLKYHERFTNLCSDVFVLDHAPLKSVSASSCSTEKKRLPNLRAVPL